MPLLFLLGPVPLGIPELAYAVPGIFLEIQRIHLLGILWQEARVKTHVSFSTYRVFVPVNVGWTTRRQRSNGNSGRFD